MPRRVTYILAEVEKAVAFEWIADLLDADAFQLDFVLLNPGPSPLEAEITARGIPCLRVPYRGHADLPRAFLRVWRHLRRLRPDAVHAHLLPAALTGLAAARLAGIPCRVYTRHHSTFHHDYAPRWVMVDRFIDAMATDTVAISENVRTVLADMERVPASKIHLIHHGFRFQDFDDVGEARVALLQERYDVARGQRVVGVVSRYIAWKGIRYIVDAAREVIRKEPDVLFVFANARGDPRIGERVRTLPAANRREIPFEEDLFALYRLFDVFVHTPVDPRVEAFGQIYVEALLSGVPSVVTLSGVAHEFIRDRRNALVVPYQAPAATARAILELLSTPELARTLVDNGRRDVEPFRAEEMVRSLAELYRTRIPT